MRSSDYDPAAPNQAGILPAGTGWRMHYTGLSIRRTPSSVCLPAHSNPHARLGLEARSSPAQLRQREPLPGLLHLLEQATALGLPMAVATASLPANIHFILDKLDLRRHFKAVVGGADVQQLDIRGGLRRLGLL